MRKNLADIVSEQSILTTDGRKIIKVPIRSLDEYRFRFGDEGRAGRRAGRRAARRSATCSQKGGKPQGPGKGQGAGEEPGVDYYEAEFTLDELTALIFEDLGLPNLEEKKMQTVSSPSIRFNDIRRAGTLPNLDKRQTLKQNLKRNAMLGKARVGDFKPEDLRFKTWEETFDRQAAAVVLAMMDVSGSMGAFEKYIARSFYYWMLAFLRTKYDNVEIVFIAHHTEAKEVTEEEFFTRGESGGTKVSSAYQLALELTRDALPPGGLEPLPLPLLGRRQLAVRQRALQGPRRAIAGSFRALRLRRDPAGAVCIPQHADEHVRADQPPETDAARDRREGGCLPRAAALLRPADCRRRPIWPPLPRWRRRRRHADEPRDERHTDRVDRRTLGGVRAHLGCRVVDGPAPLPDALRDRARRRILYEFGAYGLPGRFSHWTHGKAYHQMKTMYDYGLSKIYELVINTNPCYAFLLDTNGFVQNKMIIAHVLGALRLLRQQCLLRPHLAPDARFGLGQCRPPAPLRVRARQGGGGARRSMRCSPSRSTSRRARRPTSAARSTTTMAARNPRASGSEEGRPIRRRLAASASPIR